MFEESIEDQPSHRSTSHSISPTGILKIHFAPSEVIVHPQLETKTLKSCRSYPSMSRYCGEWLDDHWNGLGEYTFPHGVKYCGEVNDSDFDGEGVLLYPLKQRLIGKWKNGKLVDWSYDFKDISYTNPWHYCLFPDRRFVNSIRGGLKPPDLERRTSKQRPVLMPDCYDVGDGIYEAKIRCIVNDTRNRILKVPSLEEEKWIIKTCRKSQQGPVGYMPELYEYWTNGTRESTEYILEQLKEFSGEGV